MKKQIFDALKAKFTGVSDSILNRIAEKLAKTVTKEEDVTTAVEGVTFQQVLESYGDSRASEAQQTAVANYEKKHGLKDGVKVDGVTPPVPPTPPTPPAGGADPVPAWAQAIIDSNKYLTDRLNKMDGERTTASRKQQLTGVINKLPEDLRKGYSRTSVDNLTDDEFNTLLGEITTEVDGILKTTQQKGAVFGRPTQGGSNQNGELSKEQQEAIAQRETKAADGQPF